MTWQFVVLVLGLVWAVVALVGMSTIAHYNEKKAKQ